MEAVAGDAPVAAVSVTLNYLRPGSKRNRLYVAPGGHLTTTEYAPTTVTITNGRPHLDDFGLDRSGFTLLRHAHGILLTCQVKLAANTDPPAEVLRG